MKTKATINLAPPPRWGKIKGILAEQPDLKQALDAIHTEIDQLLGWILWPRLIRHLPAVSKHEFHSIS